MTTQFDFVSPAAPPADTPAPPRRRSPRATKSRKPSADPRHREQLDLFAESEQRAEGKPSDP